MIDSGPLTSEQLLAMVHRLSPGATLAESRPFAGHHDNVNLDLHLGNPTMQVVLKLYTGIDSRRTPWKETYLLRILTSETGVPVPRVLYFDDSSALVPQPWALHTRLPGEPLSAVLSTLDEFELQPVGYEAGRYLAHIHQIPLAEFGELFAAELSGQTSEQAYVANTIAQLADACTSGQLASPEIVEEFRRLATESELLDRRRPCLLHGDYTPQNIVVERGASGYHVTGILEFERALGGSPERDIAALLNWGTEQWPAFQTGLLDGYAESGTVSAKFWPRLRLYQAILAVEHLVAGGTKNQEATAVCRQRIHKALSSGAGGDGLGSAAETATEPPRFTY